jgi:hypothetical protein
LRSALAQKEHEMSLSFTGESLQTTNTTDYKAIGSQGEQIIVKASHDAIHDYGEAAVQAKAVEKYNDNQVVNHTVTVRTSDFQV